ncbi:hypothetical protein D3C76_531320 [compost metagenome]
MVCERLLVPFISQLTDADIGHRGGEDGDFLMSQPAQIVHHFIAFLKVVDGNGRILLRIILRCHANGAEHVGNRQLLQLFFDMGEIPAEEHDPLQPLLLLQFDRHFNLILILVHPLQNKRIFLPLNFLLEHLNHAIEKGIGDPLDQDGNRLGGGTLQISGAIVRNKMVLLDDLHNHGLRLFADVRMIIDGPGDRRNANPANFCNIDNCH